MKKLILILAVLAALMSGCASSQTSGPVSALAAVEGVPDALSADCVENIAAFYADQKTSSTGGPTSRNLLFSDSGSNVIWMGERIGELDSTDTTYLYRQRDQSYGIPEWMMLERILEFRYQRSTLHRYTIKNGKAGPPEKIGSFSRYSPLWVQGKGEFFGAHELDISSVYRAPEKMKDFQTWGALTDIYSIGVPLLYNYSRMDGELGGSFVSHDIIPDLLYEGGVLRVPETGRVDRYFTLGTCGILWAHTGTSEDSGVYASLGTLGLLWISSRENGAEMHGPLFGCFGWGKNSDGDPIIRLLWIPIRVGKASS